MGPNQTSPVQPASAAQTMNVMAAQQSNGPGGKLKMVLVVLVILLIIAGGGYYLYSLNNQGLSKQTQTQDQSTNSLNQLQGEVNSIEVGSTDSDFAEVDKDLQGL